MQQQVLPHNHHLLSFKSLLVKYIVIILFLTHKSNQQEFTIPVAVSDDKPSQIVTLSISTNIQQLPAKQKKFPNKFITKSIEISNTETFRYSSSVLSPIFVLDKDACHTHEGTIDITKLQDIYYHESYYSKNQKNANNSKQSNQLPYLSQSSSQQSSWIYNKKHQLLYKISSSLQISAYKINQNSISKKIQSLSTNQQIANSIEQQQTSIQKAIKLIASIDFLVNEQQRQNFINQCSDQADVLPILSKNQQKLYIFTCHAVYMVECNSVLAKTSTLFRFSDSQNLKIKENSQVFFGIQVKSVNEYIFWLSETQGIRIYGIKLDGTLDYIETLKVPSKIFTKKSKSSSSEQLPKLSSLQYRNGLLYVLTLNEGVYIYERLSAFHFQLVNYLEYLPQINKINKEIILYGDGMVIWSQSKNWQFVTEININSTKNSKESSQNNNNNPKSFVPKTSPPYTLNRYFKGYKSISEIKLITSDKPKNADPLLLIVSQRGVQLYPLKKDPRQVSMMMNGVVNNHIGSDIRNVWEISDGVFIFQGFKETEENNNQKTTQIENGKQEAFESSSSSVETYLVFLKIKYPQIQCKFEQKGQYTIFVQQQYQGEASYTSEQSLNQASSQSILSTNPTYHYQPHYYHKIIIKVSYSLSIELITLWVSILGIGILLSVIALLIYWRQNKLTFIDKLVYQIRQLQQIRRKSVEFEESSPQKAIQRKWEELREEIEGDVEYRVNSEDGWDNQLMSERNFYPKQQNTHDDKKDVVCEPISPSKNKQNAFKKQYSPIQSQPIEQRKSPKPIPPPQSNPQYVSPKRQNYPSLQQQDQIQMTDQMQKSLKSDLQISHQDIVIQSPSMDKKMQSFGQSYEETEFEELNFAANQQGEQNGQKHINLSVLDRDEDQHPRERLIQED